MFFLHYCTVVTFEIVKAFRLMTCIVLRVYILLIIIIITDEINDFHKL